MCLFSKRRPDWEEDVVFANRRHGHRHRRHSSSRVVSETIITSRPTQQFIHAPPSPPTPPPVIIKPAPTPSPPPAPPSPPSPRVELVSVEEDIRRTSSPRTSVSVSTHKKSRHGGSSRGGEEVYIERERIRERIPPPPPQVPTREEFDTYRYVHGSGHMEQPPMREQDLQRRRSRSITYESNPRVSGRVTERERVVIEGDGRRQEYYRRP